jgi:REP element-mobilizing transposase RayT
VTYLITFTCYGSHLHGDEAGSVDRRHNLVGSPAVEPNPKRILAERGVMRQLPYAMDQRCREAVLASIVDRCSKRGWNLFAVHVRTNHVHVVVEGEAAPERIMNDLKAYASRCLNEAGMESPDRKRWARHGSTRWLRDRESVGAAIRYVVEKQGDPRAIYVSGRRR